MLILSNVLFCQQIKSRNLELDDIITLLEASGYEVFSFDITDMLKDYYDITIIRKEYTKEGEVTSRNLQTLQNKVLLTEYSESDRQKFVDENRIIDPETMAVYHAEKLNIGFYPSGNDSTIRIQIHIPDFVTLNTSLKLRGLTMKDSERLLFNYNTRPFQTRAFEEELFIPLVLLGSMWYDEKYDIYRFCGEKEIDPDMSSELLKDIPHYYIFGVKFVKKQF